MRVAALTSRGFGIGHATFGPADGRPVLLLPTWPAIPMRHWKMQVPVLAAHGFRVIAYDSAGNGMGERTADLAAYEYERVVDQGIDVLDSFGVGSADVIGYSRGCTYGIDMAARYPERVRTLVLIGSAVDPTRDAWLGPDDRPDPMPVLQDYEGYLRRFYENALPEDGSAGLRAEAVGWGLESAPDIIARASNEPSLFPRRSPAQLVARVGRPVLIVHGDRDRIATLEGSRHLASALPGSRLVILHGVGHAPHLSRPDHVNAEILRFLDEHSPTRSKGGANASG